MSQRLMWVAKAEEWCVVNLGLDTWLPGLIWSPCFSGSQEGVVMHLSVWNHGITATAVPSGANSSPTGYIEKPLPAKNEDFPVAAMDEELPASLSSLLLTSPPDHIWSCQVVRGSCILKLYITPLWRGGHKPPTIVSGVIFYKGAQLNSSRRRCLAQMTVTPDTKPFRNACPLPCGDNLADMDRN